MENYLEKISVLEGVLLGAVGVLFYIFPMSDLRYFTHISGVLIGISGMITIIDNKIFKKSILIGVINIIFSFAIFFSYSCGTKIIILYYGMYSILRSITILYLVVKQNDTSKFERIYGILTLIVAIVIIINPEISILLTPFAIGAYFIISAICEIYLKFV